MFQPDAPQLTWATAEMMSSPPAPPITSFDPRAVLTKMEGTMDDGGRSPGTGGQVGVTRTLTYSQHPPDAPPRLPPSVFPFTAEHTGAGPGAALHHLACPLALFPPVWSSGSPGWGVTWEPGGRLQHRSRSSLLRRMPVRGEYSIAPKLQVKLGLGLELQAPGSHPGTRA